MITTKEILQIIFRVSKEQKLTPYIIPMQSKLIPYLVKHGINYTMLMIYNDLLSKTSNNITYARKQVFYNILYYKVEDLIQQKVMAYLQDNNLLPRIMKYSTRYDSIQSIKNSIKLPNGASFLLVAFNWNNTSEGCAFWKQHYNNIWDNIKIES